MSSRRGGPLGVALVWWRRLERGGWPLLTGLVGAALIGVALIYSSVSGYDVGADTDLSRRFAAAGSEGSLWSLPLGRDMYGRDLAQVMVYGVQAFALPGILAGLVAISGGLGLALGRPGDPAGSRVEQTFSLAIRAVPSIAWLLLASIASGQSMGWVAVVLGLVHVPDVADALRTRFRNLDRLGVLEGALAHGLRPGRIRWIHLGWLEGSPLLVRYGGRLFVTLLLAEAALSYLGDFGVAEPTPSWGRLLRDLSPLLFRAEPGAAAWVIWVPLGAIAAVGAVSLRLSEGLARLIERTPERRDGRGPA